MDTHADPHVKFSSSAGAAAGYLARPGHEKTGVIVLQEWWGLVPHIKDVADRFARLGFVALAPDLYHGKKTLDAEEASHLMNGLDWARAAVVASLQATYRGFNLVNDNPDKVEEFSDKGLDAAADKANDLTGGKYADQIQQGRDTADEKIGE